MNARGKVSRKEREVNTQRAQNAIDIKSASFALILCVLCEKFTELRIKKFSRYPNPIPAYLSNPKASDSSPRDAQIFPWRCKQLFFLLLPADWLQ